MTIPYLNRYVCGVCGKYHKNGSLPQKKCLEKQEPRTSHGGEMMKYCSQCDNERVIVNEGSIIQCPCSKRKGEIRISSELMEEFRHKVSLKVKP